MGKVGLGTIVALVILVGLLLLAIVFMAVGWNAPEGGEKMSIAGWIAMILGIVVLPHIGGPHPQRDRFVSRLFVENLKRFLDGEPLKEVVDRTAGY